MLAVAGGKGGVGKTTTALAIGCVLAEHGDRPLVADLDRDMPDLARRAGIEHSQPVAAPPAVGGVRPAGGGEHDGDGDRGVRGTPRRRGLDALAAGAPLEDVVRFAPAHPRVAVLPAGRIRADRVGAALERLSRWAGPVVLDCPAGAGHAATAPLAAADRTVLVTTAAPASVRDVVKTAAMARSLGAPPVGVVVARRPSPPHGLADAVGCPVVGCVPQSDRPHESAVRALTSSATNGSPFGEHGVVSRRNS